MSRDSASLLDMVNAAKRILKFAEGLNKSTLATNEEKQSAILYQVIVNSILCKTVHAKILTAHKCGGAVFGGFLQSLYAPSELRVSRTRSWTSPTPKGGREI